VSTIDSSAAEDQVAAADFARLEQDLRRRFDVVEQRLSIGGQEFRLVHPRSADDLISEEEFNRDERLPYWAEVWPSAYVLAGRIIGANGLRERKDILIPALSPGEREKKCLLELGCGCGLAVLAGLAAGFEVTAIDYYGEALEFVRLNAQLNHLPAPMTHVADWRAYPDDLRDFDVVVAADVLYERDYCRLMATAFKQSLRAGGVGLLTDPQRSKAESFPHECRKLRLEVSKPTVFGPLSVPGGDPSVRQTVNLFEIRRGAVHDDRA
jgi:ETFB lysine methyltransferase